MGPPKKKGKRIGATEQLTSPPLLLPLPRASETAIFGFEAALEAASKLRASMNLQMCGCSRPLRFWRSRVRAKEAGVPKQPLSAFLRPCSVGHLVENSSVCWFWKKWEQLVFVGVLGGPPPSSPPTAIVQLWTTTTTLTLTHIITL